MTNIGGGKGDPLEPVNQLNANIPDFVSAAIQHAMALNIEDRFPTVEQFWQALNADPLQKNTPIPPVPPLASPFHAPVTPAPSAPAGFVGPVGPAASFAPQVANKGFHALTPVPQEIPERTRKRPLLPILLALLALALVAGLTGAFWATSAGHHVSPATPTPAALHKATPAAKRPIHCSFYSDGRSNKYACVILYYPKVAGTHYGTVHNSTANIYSNVTIALNQHQGNIGGYVTIALPLQGSGPITSGFVQENNYIQFKVQGYNGNAPLLFMGNVQSGGSISGNYCSIDQSGRCNLSVGGQGTWNVGAASSSSSSSPASSNLPAPVFSLQMNDLRNGNARHFL